MSEFERLEAIADVDTAKEFLLAYAKENARLHRRIQEVIKENAELKGGDAKKQLEMELGRKPTDIEICKRLEVDKSEFQKLSKDSRPVGVVSLNRKWFETDSSKDIREIDVIQAPCTSSGRRCWPLRSGERS